MNTGMLVLTSNTQDGFSNDFTFTGSGFIPNAELTITFDTDTVYHATHTGTADASGNYDSGFRAWPCGGGYGTSNTITVTDGKNAGTLIQPILC